MIHVIAFIKVAPGKRDELLKHFSEIVPTVLNETGCIEYGPAIDLDSPLDIQDKDADCVSVIEKWETLSALEDHLTAEHMNQFRDAVEEIVESISIRILQPA